jgi:hypothetical protein
MFFLCGIGARETCCNKVTSRSVSRLFYNHQSTRIKGVSMQKGLALGKRVVAEALVCYLVAFPILPKHSPFFNFIDV